jgi:hypothetical protein
MARANRLKVMRVVVNPFAVLDHDGRPSAAFTLDPVNENPDRRFVGAVMKAEAVEARSPVEVDRAKRTMKGDNRPSVHDRWFEFSAEPQKVVDLMDYGFAAGYYRQRAKVAAGEVAPALLPADEAAAKRLGVPFRDPSAVVLETARVQAKRWAADHDGEMPEWASDTPVAEMHASHACHVGLLAEHKARAKPVPAASAVKGK